MSINLDGHVGLAHAIRGNWQVDAFLWGDGAYHLDHRLAGMPQTALLLPGLSLVAHQALARTVAAAAGPESSLCAPAVRGDARARPVTVGAPRRLPGRPHHICVPAALASIGGGG